MMRSHATATMMLAAAFAANPGAFAPPPYKPIAPPYGSGPGRMRRISAASLAALAPFAAVNIAGLCAKDTVA